MAEVKFNSPIEGLKGMLSKDREMYFRMVNGKTYLCRKSVKKVRSDGEKVKPKVTERQSLNRERFKKALAMCNEIMQSEVWLSIYRKRWKSQHKYATLRGYVSAKCYESLL